LESGIDGLIDGALLQQMKFETIANNLANIGTHAFKKDILSFNEALSMANSSKIDFTPGPVTHTGNRLDVALGGPGFFKVQTTNGIRYTQNGSFTLNADQFLVTHNGDTVLGQNGPIQMNGNNVSINRDGQVFSENEPVDKISVVDFKQPELLRKEGSSYFTYEGGEEDIAPAEDINIQQGYIERSNVNPTEEMIKMVEALRSFESAQKAIQVMDDITAKLVNDPGLTQ
jgi:flagellar basal-body rod protein FlgG